MYKKIISIFYKKHSDHLTCDCCGYKTLNSNDIYEICPVCCWEQDYFHNNDILCLSSANHMTLYQAQENFNNLGSHKLEFITQSRKPLRSEVKDKNWTSIQDKIETKYRDNSTVIREISNICSNLKRNGADILFYNYKNLDRIENEESELTSYYYLNDSNGHSNRLHQQLLLKSLSLILIKRALPSLTKQIIIYYKMGICYYIAWSIMLSVLLKMHNQKFDSEITDLLIDIENNNYYSLKSLEDDIKAYWYNFSNYE